jgi:putative membrane protein
MLGCQDQGRPDTMPNQGLPSDKPTQSAVRLDDASKTNIVLRQLHAANQEEIDLGKLALDKAQNADVKKFAQDMVNDHTAADSKLTSLAKRMNIDLSMSPMDPVQKAMSEASDECKKALKSDASPFDVAYFAPQVDKHNFALKLIDEGKKTASGDVKSLLEEMRPTVEGHLDHAKNIQRELTFASAIGGGPVGREREPAVQTPPAAGKDGGRQVIPARPTKEMKEVPKELP